MTTIGSTPRYPAGSYYQGGNTIAKTAQAAAERTASQQFTIENAHLPASDYVFAKLASSEQTSAERLASGDASEVFSVQFQGRTFAIAGKTLDKSLLEAAKISGETKVQFVQEKASSRLDVQV